MSKEAPLLSTLVDRLRGKYVLGVNDGAGLLDGKDTFTRDFGTTPIKSEAADRIEFLEKLLKAHGIMSDDLRRDPGNSRYPFTYCCDQIREWAGNEEGQEGLGGVNGFSSPKLGRSDASRIYIEIAQALGLDQMHVAQQIAEVYLKTHPE